MRGRGFFIGLEFVRDRERRTPFPAARRLSAQIAAEAMRRGLICYPCSGNVDGERGNTIILTPPYNASDGEIEAIADLLLSACRAVLSAPPAPG